MCKTVSDPLEINLFTKWFLVFVSTADKNSYWQKLIVRMWRCRNKLVCRNVFANFKRIEFLVKWGCCSSVVTDQLLATNTGWFRIGLKYSEVQACIKRTVLPTPCHALHLDNLVYHTDQLLEPAGNHLYGGRLLKLIFRLTKGGGLESGHAVLDLFMLLWIHYSCGQVSSVPERLNFELGFMS